MYIDGKEVYGIVYRVKNRENGKHYIGITTQEGGFQTRYNYSGTPIEKMYKKHLNERKVNRSYNEFLLEDIEKYGFDAFEVDTCIDHAMSREELDFLEDKYIAQYNSLLDINGYNKTKGGGRGKSSEETKRKNSIASSGSNNPRAQRVICLNTGEVFPYISEAAEKYGIPRTTINSCCAGYNKRAGKVNEEHAVWMYEKEHQLLNEEQIREKLRNATQEYTRLLEQNPRAIAVNIYYKGTFQKTVSTLLEARYETDVFQDMIGQYCRKGKKKIHTPTGYSFDFFEKDDKEDFDYYLALATNSIGKVINIYQYGKYVGTAETLNQAAKMTGLYETSIAPIYLPYGKRKLHLDTGYSFAEYLEDDRQDFDYLEKIREIKNVKLINIYKDGIYLTMVITSAQAAKVTGISSKLISYYLKGGKGKIHKDTGYSFHLYDEDREE